MFEQRRPLAMGVDQWPLVIHLLDDSVFSDLTLTVEYGVKRA